MSKELLLRCTWSTVLTRITQISGRWVEHYPTAMLYHHSQCPIRCGPSLPPHLSLVSERHSGGVDPPPTSPGQPQQNQNPPPWPPTLGHAAAGEPATVPWQW